MKALTLHQPWASLIALGVKTIETRSWSTSYRGPLAIHAAKRAPERGDIGGYRATQHRSPEDAPWELWWHQDGLTRPGSGGVGGQVSSPLPLGAVVATCTLVDVVPIRAAEEELPTAWESHVAPAQAGARYLLLWRGRSDTDGPMGRPTWVFQDIEDQRPYGDYSPGRFAWLLADITPLAEPVPARGRQQLWTWGA